VTKIELLWGSDRFWSRAAADIGAASGRVYVQAMTFEGDEAGRRVAAAILANSVPDRRVLVDAYTRHVVSDRFIWAPRALADAAVRGEVRATRAMFEQLAAAGVRVRMTNPVGAFFNRYSARNHKKMIVADNVAYIGGVNFSDHNFAWRDFMVRFESDAVARFLSEDFEATFEGTPRSARCELANLRLYSMDGRTNAAAFADVIRRIEAAEEEISVVSPYLTFPFIAPLATARKRGVRVRLTTPLLNNKPVVRRYLLGQAKRHDFEVRLSPEMSHVKAIVVDRQDLIVGSSNFDFASVAAEEELLAVISSPRLAEEFLGLVEPDVGQTHENLGFASDGAWLSAAVLRVASRIALLGRHGSRTAIDWPRPPHDG
jgi:cardiolipin synthase